MLVWLPYICLQRIPPNHLLNPESSLYQKSQHRLFLICYSLNTVAINVTANYFLAPAAPGFGRLVPYFERRCVRPATPAVSNVPRTM